MKFCRFNFKLEQKSLKAIVKLYLLGCFLIYPDIILSQQFPIVSICDNKNNYTCSRPTDLEHFNEKQVYDSLTLIKDTALLACCYHQLGVNAYKNDDLITSIELYKEAIKLRTAFNDGALWKSQLNLGINYFDLNEYKNAIVYLTKAYHNEGQKNKLDSVLMFRTLGTAYDEAGSFEQAVQFLEKAKKIEGNIDELNQTLNILASVLIETKDTASIRLAIQYATKMYQSTTDTFNRANAFLNLAHANSYLYEYKQTNGFNKEGIQYYNEGANKAIKYYDEAYNLLDEEDLQWKSLVLNNKAVTQHEMGQFTDAINTLQKPLQFLKESYELEYDFEYYCFYENMADNFSAMEKFDTALLYYQKALINLTNNFRNENILQNPNPADEILFIYSNPDIIRVLHLKASTAFKYYHQNKEEKYLNLANHTYQTAFDFHDQMQKDISTENSRLFQAKNIVPYIENALEVAYQKQENRQGVSEAAFRFMEKNKATVLLQSMNEADALQYANLPDSLLEQEKNLKIAITFHKKQLNEAIEYEDITEKERLDKILFEEQQQYSQLIANLENNYPDYYRLKYQQNKTHLTDVQQILDDQTTLIEYFVGDRAVYILSIQKNQAHLYKVKKPGNWKEMIKDLRQSISNVYQNDKTLFSENARYLGQLLLDSVICVLPDETTRLQIIPDAELNYIPFEVLLTEDFDKNNIQYKNLEYLLKSKAVGYTYSAALWLENNENSLKAETSTYGGYAPRYDHPDYNDLPIARQTVQDLANDLNVKAFLNQKATLSNFLIDTKNYNILHLAMHGIVNDTIPLSSYLAFSPGGQYKLYAYDLYNMKINSDLSILHACNTGSGELQKGEGVMSLSRAFTYAGCPSLVMSLWQIPEETTSGITQSFIKHLQNGEMKDIALQKAKLAYLENANKTFGSPAFWAGLVATGNLSALNFE